MARSRPIRTTPSNGPSARPRRLSEIRPASCQNADRGLLHLIGNLQHLDVGPKIVLRLNQGDGVGRKVDRVPLSGSATDPVRRVFERCLSLIQTAQYNAGHAGYTHTSSYRPIEADFQENLLRRQFPHELDHRLRGLKLGLFQRSAPEVVERYSVLEGN